MSTFTIRVSELMEQGFDFGLTDIDYPLFDETYREALNTKILKHYANYEIGTETDSMFRFALNRKMNEIMPYYNQLYLSARIQFDPLQTMNYTDFTHVTNTATGTESNSTTSDTKGKSRSVSSVTPQVQLSGNEDYAASASDVNSDTGVTASGNNTRNDSTTSSNERTLQGSQGMPAADLLQRYRATFLNIDMMVISDLAMLFMQLWDNGDEYSSNNGSLYGLGTGFFGIL